ncbi:hypothetical protein DVH05_010027 [Phytophthora capsici]|nr:hypothetical protein DVH05_010027 [Phytophthora capsici]
MRVSNAILLAVIAVFTISAGLTSASNPAQLQEAVPGSTNTVRFLRKSVEDKSEDLTNIEERGVLGGLAKKVKQILNGEERLAKLFKMPKKKLMEKGIGPENLTNAAKRLEKAGWSARQVAKFKAKGEKYSTYYYNNFIA